MVETDAHVRIERDFDAPPGAVWRMWTEPDLFRRWYGPAGARVTAVEIDATVGGRRFVGIAMDTPRGEMAMWFAGLHTRVEAPGALTYTEAMCDEGGKPIPPAAMGMPLGTPEETEVSFELTDLGGRTRMVLVHAGVPAGSPGEGGWRQALDKLTLALEEA